jgi:hypothetical protein
VLGGGLGLEGSDRLGAEEAHLKTAGRSDAPDGRVKVMRDYPEGLCAGWQQGF